MAGSVTFFTAGDPNLPVNMKDAQKLCANPKDIGRLTAQEKALAQTFAPKVVTSEYTGFDNPLADKPFVGKTTYECKQK